tara:strand:+ start:1167 stop:1472 length:306 start_codon:yes stop_codon:yes gene_type:complete
MGRVLNQKRKLIEEANKRLNELDHSTEEALTNFYDNLDLESPKTSTTDVDRLFVQYLKDVIKLTNDYADKFEEMGDNVGARQMRALTDHNAFRLNKLINSF